MERNIWGVKWYTFHIKSWEACLFYACRIQETGGRNIIRKVNEVKVVRNYLSMGKRIRQRNAFAKIIVCWQFGKIYFLERKDRERLSNSCRKRTMLYRFVPTNNLSTYLVFCYIIMYITFNRTFSISTSTYIHKYIYNLFSGTVFVRLTVPICETNDKMLDLGTMSLSEKHRHVHFVKSVPSRDIHHGFYP